MASKNKVFCMCRCFFTDNYYSKITGKHYRYVNWGQFQQDYTQSLDQLGEDDKKHLSQELEKEQRRRHTLVDAAKGRRRYINENYKPLHVEVYTLKDEFLDPSFLHLVNYCKSAEATKEGTIKRIQTWPATRVYSFPVFTRRFCDQLLEELDHVQDCGIPITKPNTMNQYGIMLDELGFDEGFITPLKELYLQHVANVLFPEWSTGGLDSHKAFTVRYELAKDTSLAFHFDNAEVTLNICLGRGFDDGSLFFGKMRTETQTDEDMTEVNQTVTHGVFHRGQHKHGAMPIQDGVRINLVVWMRNSSVRNQMCPMCNQTPDKVEVKDGFGDGFTADQVDVCNVL